MDDSNYFPNECIVCQSTKKLSRCSSCNMVQYCGESHQLQHWPQHKSFCKAISNVMKKHNITHIFEEFTNIIYPLWSTATIPIVTEVIKALKRIPNSIETNILKFPRVCFICREAKQEKLKNCPNCPFASFCEQHKNNKKHEKYCQIMQNRSDNILKNTKFRSNSFQNKMISIASGTKFLKTNDKTPTSIRQFFNNYTIPECKISENEKIFFSEFFSISLTMFKFLQMIYYDNYPTELIIHIDSNGQDVLTMIGNYWETLLHLLLNVKILKIIFIGEEETKMQQEILCNNCKTMGKKLFIETYSITYEMYLTQSNYEKPSVIANLNIYPLEREQKSTREDWLNTIERFSKISCPIIFSTFNEDMFVIVENDILNYSNNNKFKIIYNGFNNFSSLMYSHLLGDGTLHANSQFLIVLQGNLENNSELKINRPRLSFYQQICHVCRKLEAKIICNRCRIISYCNNKHRDQDQIHHKDICRAILILMKEMNTANLFDNAKTLDLNLWLLAKIDIMKKVKTKLAREMKDYEKEMFLFPKACAICHNSDSSLLRSCECGTFLCKIHYKDENHKKLCKELAIAYKMSTTENKQISTLVMNSSKDLYEKLPSTMFEFLNSNILLSKICKNQRDNYQNLATSNLLSAALTLRNIINKFDSFLTMQTMIIHIIGANRKEIQEVNSWKIFLYSLRELKNLEICFIRPEIENFSEKIINTSDFETITIKRLKIQYVNKTYDKYFTCKKFIKPQIILGCNLNIHESKLFEISENTWKETILTVEKVGVPFILTSGTKERAEMEHKIICDLLGKSVNFQFFEENPYSSLTPERDFETEGVMYANKFVIAYDGKYQNSSNLTNENKIKINENSQLTTNITITEENNSKAKEIINKTKEIKVCKNLSNENKNETSDLLLLQQRNKFLIDENEKLKEQLISANTQIAEQKNQILNLKKIFTNFVENNQVLQLEKIYNDFVEKFQENINVNV